MSTYQHQTMTAQHATNAIAEGTILLNSLVILNTHIRDQHLNNGGLCKRNLREL